MPESPVQAAFDAIKERLNLESESDHDDLEFIYGQLAQVWQKTQQETRAEVADYLDRLGDGRMDYVGTPLPTDATKIEKLGGMRGTIYGEATGAKHLARIIRREIDDRGWLPSWRWTN